VRSGGEYLIETAGDFRPRPDTHHTIYFAFSSKQQQRRNALNVEALLGRASNRRPLDNRAGAS
jgi:hypothetical protein